MTAHEHQVEILFCCDPTFGPRMRSQQEGYLLLEGSLTPQELNRLAACNSEQPRSWLTRNATIGPSLDGSKQSVLNGFLGEVEIAEEPGQNHGQMCRMLPSDLSERRQDGRITAISGYY